MEHSKITNFRNARLVYIFLALFGLFFILCWFRLDPDFGWHLTTGNYIRLHGIPYKDIYTYTVKGHVWVDHEWGNDLILSFIYGWGGFWLTSAFYSILWTLALLISGYRARVIVLLLAAAALAPYAGVRTITWSALFFSFTLAVLEKRIKISAWILPPIFLFWANVHAGFIAGLALITYFAIKNRNLKLLYLLLACFLVTFINPYGLGLYKEIARTLFDPAMHGQITEWKSFFLPGPMWLFAIMWAVGYFIFENHKIKSLLSLPPLLFLVGLSATRNFPFFILGSVNKLDEYLGDAIKAIPKKLIHTQRLVLASMLFLFGLIFLVTLYVAYGTLLVAHNRYSDLPVAAVSYLNDHHCEGNLFNDYNYGGYLIWKLPSQPDFIDGRMSTWQPQMEQYFNIIDHPNKYYPSVFAKYDIRCALLQTSTSKLVNALEKNNWNQIIRTNNSILLEKY